MASELHRIYDEIVNDDLKRDRMSGGNLGPGFAGFSHANPTRTGEGTASAPRGPAPN